MTGRRTNQAAVLGLILISAMATTLWGQKFYPDDPLEAEPTPMATPDPGVRGLSHLLEFFSTTFGEPGERHPEVGVIPAGAVNTLGEVMDSPWYTNRHGKRRLSSQELIRGPGDGQPPLQDQPWRVLAVKQFGERPGILIVDSQRQMYLLRFDPPGNLEMSTGAEMVSSKIFYAFGYNVLENYIVYFQRSQMVPSEAGEEITSMGERRDLTDEDLDSFLKTAASDRQRGYRAVATRVSGNWDKLLGNFQFFGTRSDDPNDIIPHEPARFARPFCLFGLVEPQLDLTYKHARCAGCGKRHPFYPPLSDRFYDDAGERTQTAQDSPGRERDHVGPRPERQECHRPGDLHTAMDAGPLPKVSFCGSLRI